MRVRDGLAVLLIALVSTSCSTVPSGQKHTRSPIITLASGVLPAREFPVIAYGVQWGTKKYPVEWVCDDLKSHGVNVAARHSSYRTDFGTWRSLLDAAAKRDMGVMPILNVYCAYDEIKKDPTLAIKTRAGKPSVGGILSFAPGLLSPCHPRSAELAGQYVERVIEEIGRSPALLALNLDDEPGLGWPTKDRDTLGDYSEAARAAFRKATGLDAPAWPPEELRQKYPSGTVVSDTDPWYLWSRFRTSNFPRLYEKLAVRAKKPRPDILLTTQVNSGSTSVFGFCWRDMFRPLDVVSVHAYPGKQPISFSSYSLDLANTATSGPKPIWFMIAYFDFSIDLCPIELLRTQFWQGVAGGARGLAFFLYNVPADAGNKWIVHNDPKLWDQAGAVMRRIQSIAPALLQCRRTPRSVAMLLSTTTEGYQANWDKSPLEAWRQWHQMQFAYDALTRAQIPVEIIDEQAVLDGSLEQFEALLLIGVEHLPRSVHEKIASYNRSGGRTFACDRTLILPSRTEKLGFDCAAFYDAILAGKPRNAPLYREPSEQLAQKFLAQLDFIARPVVADTHDVILRELSGPGYRLLFVINNSLIFPYGETPVSGKPLDVEITVKNALYAYDLFTRKEVARGAGGGQPLRFSAQVAPGDASVFVLTQAPPKFEVRPYSGHEVQE